MSFVGVEPIDVLRFEPVPGERAYLTLGMSRRPMTSPTAVIQDPGAPRAELMLHVRSARGEEDAVGGVWRRLAVLAAAPAVEGVVYTAGMTVDLGEPLAPASRCTGVLVGESALAPIAAGTVSVSVLQVTPATSAELGWCRVRGSTALRERWAEHGTDLLDLARASVDLG